MLGSCDIFLHTLIFRYVALPSFALKPGDFMKKYQLTGKCLCGVIKAMAGSASSQLDACHCNMCRNWGGAPYFAIDCGSDVTFEGAEHIKCYDSSAWAERGFCTKCGTHLFYRLKEQNQYMMPAGLFSNLPEMDFHMEIFIDEKPAYYSFSNPTEKLTGAEVFARFTSGQDA